MPGRPPKTPEEFEVAKRLGANIRAARELLGLSGTELGSSVGRSKKAVSDWEVQGKGPEGYLIPKIAERLGVSAGWLFHGILQMPDRNGPDAIARRLVKRLGLSRARALLSLPEEQATRAIDDALARLKSADTGTPSDTGSDSK